MFVLAIYKRAKATPASKEAWRYGNSHSLEPAKGPALSPAPAALLATSGHALAATGWAVSSGPHSLCPGCTDPFGCCWSRQIWSSGLK